MRIIENIFDGIERVLDRIESFFENPLGLLLSLGLACALIGLGLEVFRQLAFR